MDIDAINQVLTAPVKRSLSDEIVVRLRDAILTGAFPQGERLREENLAASLKVSRGPIREALSKLEREGLVVLNPNRGATVTLITREDLAEVYSLRLALEKLAATEAIKHPNEKCFPEMQACVSQMGETIMHGSTAGHDTAALDVHFHELLVQAANHTRLYRHWMELRPQIQWLLLARTIYPDYRDYAVSSHQGILDAIRTKNQILAIDLLEGHMQGSYERVLRAYSK